MTTIIAYINIDGKSYPKEANEYLNFVKTKIQSEFGDTYTIRIIPITKGEDRLEFKHESKFDGKADEIYQSINENFCSMTEYMEQSFLNFSKKMEKVFTDKKKK